MTTTDATGSGLGTGMSIGCRVYNAAGIICRKRMRYRTLIHNSSPLVAASIPSITRKRP